MNSGPLTPRGPLNPSKKINFFIYGTILLKFDEHFYVFTYNN